MDDHLAVVVGQYLVSPLLQAGLEAVGVGYIAVVRADQLNLAAHQVGLAVGVGDRSVGSPAYLTYESLSPEGRYVQFPGDLAWSADLFYQHYCAIHVYEGRAG
jgi:hypothetical protein